MSSLKLIKNLYIFGFAILSSPAFFIAATSIVLASPQVTFNGNGVGPIPDSTSQFPNCQIPGAPLNITFNVTGLSANVQRVELTMTFNPRIKTEKLDLPATFLDTCSFMNAPKQRLNAANKRLPMPKAKLAD